MNVDFSKKSHVLDLYKDNLRFYACTGCLQSLGRAEAFATVLHELYGIEQYSLDNIKNTVLALYKN